MAKGFLNLNRFKYGKTIKREGKQKAVTACPMSLRGTKCRGNLTGGKFHG